MELEGIVDLDRYLAPGVRTRVIAEGRRALAESGSVTFDAFIVPAALRTMLDEALAARPHWYRRDGLYSAYIEEEATGGADHPTRRLHRYALDAVANDRLDAKGMLSTLYRNPTFIRFIADVLSEPELYPLADPMLGLTLTYLSEGDEHGWHFDRNDFVVSLLLQPPVDGGVFEFAPFIRSEAEPNFEPISAIMDGAPQYLQRIPPKAGTLALFAGKRSLHRVSPVTGGIQRIIALLSYDRNPNVVHEESIHIRTFGRTLSRA